MKYILAAVAVVAFECLAVVGFANANEPADDSFMTWRKEIALIIDTIERQHLSHKLIDKHLSEQWFTRFIHELDPRRLIFLKSDIKSMSRYQETHGSLARSSEISHLSEIHRIYRERLKVTMTMAVSSASIDHNFLPTESVERTFVGHAETDDELRERWRKIVKLDFLNDRIAGIPPKSTKLRIEQWARDRQDQAIDVEHFIETYLNSLARTYDPHSEYYSPSSIEEFIIRQ
ncbi:hypothetical protein GC163_24280 [bacterium]|nr:hypothetical protein [bacterium]